MLQRVLVSAAVELANEEPFAIGDLLVEPAHLRVSRGDDSHPVEPRVMQVLVVLGQADGRVVGRAELVERCWDGRIVGENAIQRIISRLRGLGSATGAFEVEAVTKVGYLLRPTAVDQVVAPPGLPEAVLRLDVADWGAAEPIAAPLAPASRRHILAAAAAVIATAGGFAAWRGLNASDPDAVAAARLVEKAREAQLAGLQEQQVQAVAYLHRATELDPKSAEAWGALALALQGELDAGGVADMYAHAARVRASARRALALDSGNVNAKVALATIPPNFRNWAANEQALREILAQHGSHPATEEGLAYVHCDTGRWVEAISYLRRVLVLEPFNPGNQMTVARALWGQGQWPEANRMLDDALRLWPNHRGVWHMRFDFLATTGRPEAALAMLSNPSTAPLVEPGNPAAAMKAFATAMHTRTAADMALANASVGTPEKPGPLGQHPMYFLALGRVDDAFVHLERFYFGGPGQAAPDSLSRRKTTFLFSMSAEPLRADPRYASLIERIGLEDFWRKTGTRPDGPMQPRRAPEPGLSSVDATICSGVTDRFC